MEKTQLYNQKGEKIKEIAEKYGLKLLLLFGSRVKDEKYIRKDSDFDVAYLSEKDLDIKQEIELNCDLIDAFGSDKVDLVDIKRVNSFLRNEIAKNSKLFYGKKIDYLEFKAFAFKDYISHKSLFELQDFLIKKRHQLLREKIYGQ
jgi:predicted nucleotidyltransferase